MLPDHPPPPPQTKKNKYFKKKLKLYNMLLDFGNPKNY